MKRRAALALLPLALSACGTLPGTGSAGADDLPKQFAARQILVTLPETLEKDWEPIGRELAARHGIETSGEFPLRSIGVDCLVYKVPGQQSVQTVMETLRADPRTVLVQENQVFEGLQGGESDPYAAVAYAPRMIHADSAHRMATGRGVKVAVVDTGADKEHPDLKGRVVRTANFVEGGDRSFSQDRHGTAVAGVIGARANDGIGIYGIAPEADVLVYKACGNIEESRSKAMCSSWSLAKAVDAAIADGARVINLSLAGPEDALLRKLLETAHRRGINIVAATLETQPEPGFPASLDFSVPVVSTGPDGKIVQPVWLAHGSGAVAAPGVEILSTTPREGYDFLSGSSLAAAHVSGVIALLLERQPDLSPARIKELLGRDGKAIDACALLMQASPGSEC